MSINVIAHNLMAMNADRVLGVNSKNKAKSMEKLSSGYRINRAADDAAGLAVSEKMRRMIRGLDQGTENARDGVSWVQTGDGALEEVDAMLHRMTELTIKSLNGTWSESDRYLMQAEFEQLQKEIDRLTDAATFNEKQIFADHELPYYQFEGNVKWLSNQKHTIVDGSNSLNITYTKAAGAAPQTASITVPAGRYTTKELIDEIDSALEEAGLKDIGFSLEYTSSGTCNLNFDGGLSIDSVTGGLSYLLYDMYEGGSVGALIGTTQFNTDDEESTLDIVAGQNDYMEFDIESLDGTTQHITLQFEDGASLTRPQIIDYINEQLAGTSVVAVKYGNSIKLTSDECIITGLKGNMFKVDDPEKGELIYTSVFYDNIGYGEAVMYPAQLIGGAVLYGENYYKEDKEHHYYNIIEGINDILYIKPNGSDSVTTLKIDEGLYTADDMAAYLQKFFNANNLDLEAESYSDGIYTGLKITSTIKGVDSEIGIDTNSSAYKTLFITRAYNTQEEPAIFERDTDEDRNAYYIGGKSFGTGGDNSTDLPFIVKENENDKFTLNIDGKTYIIKLDAREYKTLDDVIGAVNNAIKAAANKLTSDEKTLLESITAIKSGSKIRLDTTSEATRISASACSENGKVNNGYTELFTTSVYYSEQVATSTSGTATLNTVIDLPAMVTESNKTLRITVDGKTYNVELTPGKKYGSYQEILDEINAKLPGASSEMVNITFTRASDTGSGQNFSNIGRGRTTPPSYREFKGEGTGGKIQGQVGGGTPSVPAKVTIPTSGAFPYTINSTNNKLLITINGVTKEITLDSNKTYDNINELKTMLQEKLNMAFPNDGVDITTSGNNLIFTSRLVDNNGHAIDGKSTNIYCDTNSSFLNYINTTYTAASLATSQTLKNSISLGSNNKFKFTYKGADGVQKTVNLTLTASNVHDPASLRDEINRQLGSTPVIASLSWDGTGYRLVLTTTDKGENCEINYDSADGGNSAASIFSDITPRSAEIMLDQEIQESFTVDSNTNKFIVYVNGYPQEITLTAGKTYSRASFIQELNQKLKGATAELVGGKLKLTTTEKGPSASLFMDYSYGGSSMSRIFGQKEVPVSGLKASFSPDHKLQVTAVDANGNTVRTSTVRVTSATGSIFQLPKREESTLSGNSYNGYHSKKHAICNGASLDDSKVVIDQWNCDLTFTYWNNGVPTTGTITLDENKDGYTYEELQRELQEKLDKEFGKGALNVEVTKNGVNIIASKPGSKYYMLENSFSGGFYYNVLRRNSETKRDLNDYVTQGGYDAPVYAVGRKDVKHNNTVITKGVNDTLSLDFTIGTEVIKLTMKLTPGTYKSGQLINEIQKKLNEQLVANDLPAGLIEAQIGGINTGVAGNNDANALVFKLAEHVKLPVEDVVYKIDGIGGNAAFSVFYQTDGDISVAYVAGTKDVSKGVTIPEDSELSFDVDGEHYSITIEKGSYTTQEILEKLNGKFKEQNIPLIPKITDGNLYLTSSKYGKHNITNVSGSAKRYLFFQENGKTKGEKDIWLRVGSESGDGVEIERPVVNTVSLGLNSLVINKPKYAEKALNRIKAALTKVSDVRTNFGVKQNRLDHTINKNNNTSENMQAAESAIRDTDIAEEIMEFSINNILENVAASMLAQANTYMSFALDLLQ